MAKILYVKCCFYKLKIIISQQLYRQIAFFHVLFKYANTSSIYGALERIKRLFDMLKHHDTLGIG